MDRERNSLERELADLGFGSEREAGGLKLLGSRSLCAWWRQGSTDKSGKFKGDPKGTWRADLTSLDARILVKKKMQSVVLPARLYEGRTSDIALVFGGIHGDETESERVTAKLEELLDAAYSANKRAHFTTVLIRDLFKPKRQFEDDPRYVTDKGIEPNRNFPLAGESIRTARARRKAGQPEALHPDQRMFPGLGPRSAAKKSEHASDEILPEIRVLAENIGCLKPIRAISVHSHSRKKVRGNDPGVFVDPRGGFDVITDAPLSPEARTDDLIADAMAKAVAKVLNDQTLTAEALAGNIPSFAKGGALSGVDTVHYSFSAAKTPGTSFGMWGPAAIDERRPDPGRPGALIDGIDNRPGMTTITLETPQSYLDKKSLKAIIDAWAEVIVSTFLVVS
jgi:hypothetical protein